MKVLQNEQIELELWKRILSNSVFSSPFQTSEFYQFYNSLEGFSADVFAIEKDDEYVALSVVTIQKEKGVKSFFSRRGIIYGGPLLLEKGRDYLFHLLTAMERFYKEKLIYIETRNYFNYSNFNSKFEESGFNYLPWLNFHLNTTEAISMNKAISSSRLRQIKKAIKNGSEWKEAKSIEDVNVFYEILLDLYKNKIKKPLFNREFFLELYKQNIGKYLLVYYEDKVIGGIICPILNEKVIYEFYVCGLDNEYKDQYPSVMATWAAIEYANQNNIPLFDFMGAGSPDEVYGVREFKSRFGGIQVEHGRYINILNPFLYKTGVLGLKVLSKFSK